LSDEAKILEALRQSKAEAVIHFAAYALVGESMVNPGKYFGNIRLSPFLHGSVRSCIGQDCFIRLLLLSGREKNGK